MSDWSSAQYMKFGSERTQPSIDLISRLSDAEPARVLDIGCGPGNSTFVLKARFPHAEIIGVDSSENMLNRARDTYPDMDFMQCTVPDGLDELKCSFDLIFSNACIHWIPDQKKLLTAITDKLSEGGVLAVQIPLIQEAPFYKILFTMVKEEKWHRLSSIQNFHNLLPEEYYDLLFDLGLDFDIWQTTYYHTVDNADGVVQWYSGSGLRPYLAALTDSEQTEFLQDLHSRIDSLYPIRHNGKCILKMPRLFFTAKKK